MVFPDGIEYDFKNKLVQTFRVNEIFNAIRSFSGNLKEIEKGTFHSICSPPPLVTAAGLVSPFLTKLRFENHKRKHFALFQKRSELHFEARLHFHFLWFIRDRGRIQTCNPQSRNLMRYSVAPRGLNIMPIYFSLL